MICTNYGHHEVYDQEGYIEGNKTFFIKKGGIDSLIKNRKRGSSQVNWGKEMIKKHSGNNT